MDASVLLQQNRWYQKSHTAVPQGQPTSISYLPSGEGWEAGRVGSHRSSLLQIYFGKGLPIVVGTRCFWLLRQRGLNAKLTYFYPYLVAVSKLARIWRNKICRWWQESKLVKPFWKHLSLSWWLNRCLFCDPENILQQLLCARRHTKNVYGHIVLKTTKGDQDRYALSWELVNKLWCIIAVDMNEPEVQTSKRMSLRNMLSLKAVEELHIISF
jgi:hypothetical protein